MNLSNWETHVQLGKVHSSVCKPLPQDVLVPPLVTLHGCNWHG
jgi:hypothetical protein